MADRDAVILLELLFEQMGRCHIIDFQEHQRFDDMKTETIVKAFSVVCELLRADFLF